MAHKQGLASPYAYTGAIITPIYGVAINYFLNRTPLAARLPIKPQAAPSFTLAGHGYRPSTSAVADGGGLNNAVTTVTVADSAPFQIGDVIQVGSEYMLITALNTTANTLTVTRGYAGTTAAAQNTASTIYLVANTRTGSEVDVDGTKPAPDTATQYCQTIQHPYQVGGSLAATTPDFALPEGAPTVVDNYRMLAMQNCMDDIERSYYYGKSVSLAADTTRPMQAGLKALLTTNNTTSPVNASSYKPTDLERDTLQKCFDNGGKPDLLVMSSNWRTAFLQWGFPLQLIPAGSSRLGIAIDSYSSPFLGDVNVVLVPTAILRSYTCVCLTSEEVAQRVKRGMFDKPRGSRGDAVEGDIIWEGAIEVKNQAHHAWLEGVTGFAAQT